jgi:type IV fimbrial biogenesis protein FimT
MQKVPWGHSLVEAMVAIAILSITAAIAAPDLRGLLQSQRASALASIFHAELNLARHTAIVRGHRVVLCRSPEGLTCTGSGAWADGFLSFVDVNGNNLREAEEPILRHTAGTRGQGAQLHIGEGRRHIAFRPDGRGGGTNLSAVVCDGNGQPRRTVVISVSGRVRMGNPGPSARCA